MTNRHVFTLNCSFPVISISCLLPLARPTKQSGRASSLSSPTRESGREGKVEMENSGRAGSSLSWDRDENEVANSVFNSKGWMENEQEKGVELETNSRWIGSFNPQEHEGGWSKLETIPHLHHPLSRKKGLVLVVSLLSSQASLFERYRSGKRRAAGTSIPYRWKKEYPAR